MAELVPVEKRSEADIRAAIAELKAFQSSHPLEDVSVREMLREGRKR